MSVACILDGHESEVSYELSNVISSCTWAMCNIALVPCFRIDTHNKGERNHVDHKTLFVVAMSIFTAFKGVSAANAQSQKCYTLASLQGNYAIVADYGANVATALAIRSYDGNGNLTGTFLVNGPTAGSTTGARTLTTGTKIGTYTVNCNGTGQFLRVLTTSAGSVTQVDDFVITGAMVVGRHLIATSIKDAQETPSAIVPGGIFVTRTQTRLPDDYTSDRDRD